MLDALRFSLASDIVELVVLTGDDAFLQTLREAVGNARRLWHVPAPDKVSDLLVAGEVGILVLDVQVLNEVPTVFIGQIKRQFPDLVVVVAGTRDAESSLAGLISSGMIYRFIHKPMSPGRATLFADAAVKRYEEQRRHAADPKARAAAAVTGQQFLANVVAAGSLTLVKSVNPIYPKKAELNRVTGWVELDFTVAENGAVKDIAVHAASNPGVFDDAAIGALSQWRYKPILRDAIAVPQRARIRVRFVLKD
jgi:TonB family protein